MENVEILAKFFTNEIVETPMFGYGIEELIEEQSHYIPKIGQTFVDSDSGDSWTLENDKGTMWTVVGSHTDENFDETESVEKIVETWNNIVQDHGPMIFIPDNN